MTFKLVFVVGDAMSDQTQEARVVSRILLGVKVVKDHQKATAGLGAMEGAIDPCQEAHDAFPGRV